MNLLQIDNREGRVKLNDAVNPWSADELIDDLEQLYGASAVEAKMEIGGFTAAADDALETVHMEINSPGGSVFDGYRVFNAMHAMRQRGVNIVATVNGKAASMATVILMGANEKRITKGSAMLVHDASVTTHGNASEHLKAAQILDAISGEISEIYAEQTGSTPEEMRELMAEDRWMPAKEALEKGFVDKIITGSQTEKIDKSPNKPHNESNPMSILDKFKPDEALTAKVESLETDLAASLTELQEAKAELVNKDEAIADLEARIAETEQSSKELAAQAAEAAEAVAKSQKETEEAKESAGALAAEMLAEAAHPQIEADNAAPATDESIVADYLKLPIGPARAEYRAKHSEVFARFDEITKPNTK
jgi:ATP-dependent Clp endopeptidase proteolytic subunit ClpP